MRLPRLTTDAVNQRFWQAVDSQLGESNTHFDHSEWEATDTDNIEKKFIDLNRNGIFGDNGDATITRRIVDNTDESDRRPHLTYELNATGLLNNENGTFDEVSHTAFIRPERRLQHEFMKLSRSEKHPNDSIHWSGRYFGQETPDGSFDDFLSYASRPPEEMYDPSEPANLETPSYYFHPNYADEEENTIVKTYRSAKNQAGITGGGLYHKRNFFEKILSFFTGIWDGIKSLFKSSR